MPTNFLHTPGTNGFLVTPLAATSGTDLSGIANGSTATCTPVLNQTSLGSAQRGLIYFSVVTAGPTVTTAGANLTGWYLHSPNAGTTYEGTQLNAALARPPDFIIPLPSATLVTGVVYFASGIPNLPYDTFKLYVQNNSGTALTSNNHVISIAPVADSY